MPFDSMPEPGDLNRIGQTLWDAADIMDRRGKCEGFLERRDGRVCVRGAILIALGEKPLNTSYGRWKDDRNFTDADNALGDYLGADAGTWNNNPRCSKKECVAALRGAALTQRETVNAVR